MSLFDRLKSKPSEQDAIVIGPRTIISCLEQTEVTMDDSGAFELARL